MKYELAAKIRGIFKDAGHDLSILEVKNMTPIASDVNESFEKVYAISKKGYVYIAYIAEIRHNNNIYTQIVKLN